MQTMTLDQYITQVDDNVLACIEHNDKPYVIYKGAWYSDLSKLLNNCSLLRDDANLFNSRDVLSLAEVTNWLFHGDQFVLDNSFRPRYAKGRFVFQIRSNYDEPVCYRVKAPVIGRLPSACPYKYQYERLGSGEMVSSDCCPPK